MDFIIYMIGHLKNIGLFTYANLTSVDTIYLIAKITFVRLTSNLIRKVFMY